MRYLVLLLLLFALPLTVQAQTPPSELRLFETWVPVRSDSISTGVRLIYAGATAPADSAEVAYGQSGSAAAWRAIVDREVWAKPLTGPAFPVSVELGEIEYYLSQNPDERAHLEMLLLVRDTLGFVRYFRPSAQ